MMNQPVRMESDSLGEVAVPATALWGAQTQRSLEHFRISTERMPEPLLMALARVKRAAARVNRELTRMRFRFRCGRPVRAPRPT
jgi:fumarate hydratase class II